MCCQTSLLRDSNMSAALSSANEAQNTALGSAAARSGHDHRSPLARWLAEPVSFELESTHDDGCSWRAVSPRSRSDVSQQGACGSASFAPAQTNFPQQGPGGFIMVPVLINTAPTKTLHSSLHIPAVMPPMFGVVPSSSASTSASSSHSACPDIGSDEGEPANTEPAGVQPKLSASAARRRRRQKAAAYAAAAAAASAKGTTPSEDSKPRSRDAPTDDCSMDIARGGRACDRQNCSRLSAQLKLGGEALTSALEEIGDSFWRLCNDAYGCRVVQEAFELVDHYTAASLAEQLCGNVRDAISSPHGNYVVQKMIAVLPGTLISFIADELLGYAVETARHRFGCRVLCRLIEHAGSEVATVALVDELLFQASDLCADEYGHHVIESVLEHGQPEQRRVIARALCTSLAGYTSDRSATYVIKAALAQCCAEDAQSIVDSLLRSKEQLLALAENQYGHHVVVALLRRHDYASHVARAMLQALTPQLMTSPFGCRVLDEVQQRH
eukprot:TRINITY_DN75175_c0_g1_i1.p1 TRINITY_DN75175_c0_g1~~TRINITY_DN75175_c0_g1_i1.p1  ORF type:complete len:499 (+),score=88.48 TRINITY_DN75175_c0_g1_i1:62-1558(+)